MVVEISAFPGQIGMIVRHGMRPYLSESFITQDAKHTASSPEDGETTRYVAGSSAPSAEVPICLVSNMCDTAREC